MRGFFCSGDITVKSFGRNGEVLVNRSGTNIPVYSEYRKGGLSGNYAVTGEIIGYIKPDDFYSCTAAYEGTAPYIFGITMYGGAAGAIKQGYYATSLGPGGNGNYDWVKYQEAFNYYGCDGTSLITPDTAMIDGETYMIFTTKKDLDRRSLSGKLLPRLPKGTTLACKGVLSGNSYPNYMFFDRYENGSWDGVGEHYIDINGNPFNEGGYVDLGLHYGASPENRVIW